MIEADRKAAVAAYKKRKVAAGIFRIRCTATSEAWVGQARDLATVQNRIWFTLRLGTDPHRSLQDAWKAHGEEAFAFDVLECLADDEPLFSRNRVLQERLALWADELAATRI